jgi:hypothetical protein
MIQQAAQGGMNGSASKAGVTIRGASDDVEVTMTSAAASPFRDASEAPGGTPRSRPATAVMIMTLAIVSLTPDLRRVPRAMQDDSPWSAAA